MDALEIAQRWRERDGRERDEQWQRFQDGMAAPHQRDGPHPVISTEPYLRRDNHPALLCALGLLPATRHVERGVMTATLQDARAD